MQLSQQHKSRFLIQKNQRKLKKAKNNFGQKKKPLTLKSRGFALSLNAVLAGVSPENLHPKPAGNAPNEEEDDRHGEELHDMAL